MFEPSSGQSKDYIIGFRCLSVKHITLRSKSKDWMAQNQDNESPSGVAYLPVDYCFIELALQKYVN